MIAVALFRALLLTAAGRMHASAPAEFVSFYAQPSFSSSCPESMERCKSEVEFGLISTIEAGVGGPDRWEIYRPAPGSVRVLPEEATWAAP